MAGPGAGELDRRITIQTLSLTKDSEGGMADDWSNLATVWAKVRNLSGNERRVTVEGGQVAEARTEFTIRYRSGLNERMRVSYAGKVYNIRHLNDFNAAHEFIVITCDTGLNDGR
jgi:SPP1 family predicted phage head-tail adaptor